MLLLHVGGDPDQLWNVPAVATTAIVATTVVYLRGFRVARQTRPIELPNWRAWSFVAGMFVLFLALASPVDTFADDSLLAHMTQHLLLMSFVPPLVVLGCPTVPLLRGLPSPFVTGVLGPVLRSSMFEEAVRFLRAPAVGWIAMNAAYLCWHVPAAYELALRSERWHETEHMCFLLTSILFWWNVLEPWPTRSTLSRWAAIPYLLSADIVNTGVSAYLCFAGRVLYSSYEKGRGLFGLSPLNDQVAAGAEMWVLGSLIFLVPVTIISFRALSRSTSTRNERVAIRA